MAEIDDLRAQLECAKSDVAELRQQLATAETRIKEFEAVQLGSDGWPVSLAKHYAGHFAGKTFSDPGEASAYLASLISGAVEEAIEIARAKPTARIKELEEAANQAWTCLLTGKDRETTISMLQSALAHKLRAALSTPANKAE